MKDGGLIHIYVAMAREKPLLLWDFQSAAQAMATMC